LPRPCIVVVARWHCCCFMSLVGIACWHCCVVGVVGWRWCFSSSSSLVLETLLHYFLGTLRCDGVPFVSGASLVCCYRDSSCIGRFILALVLLVPISKHLVAFVQVLQEVQTYVSCMKTKIPNNMLNLDSAQWHNFPPPHKNNWFIKCNKVFLV